MNFRGVHFDKVIRTEQDVLDHCYPQIAKKVADPVPAPAVAPVATISNSKPKRTKSKVEASFVPETTELMPETQPEVPPEVPPEVTDPTDGISAESLLAEGHSENPE